MFNYEIHVKNLTYLQKINVILYLHIFDGKVMTPNTGDFYFKVAIRHIDYITCVIKHDF